MERTITPGTLKTLLVEPTEGEMEKDWLYQRVTVTEAEASNMVEHELLGDAPIPFGFENQIYPSHLRFSLRTLA